jgi:hypothetical protein
MRKYGGKKIEIVYEKEYTIRKNIEKLYIYIYIYIIFWGEGKSFFLFHNIYDE